MVQGLRFSAGLELIQQGSALHGNVSGKLLFGNPVIGIGGLQRAKEPIVHMSMGWPVSDLLGSLEGCTRRHHMGEVFLSGKRELATRTWVFQVQRCCTLDAETGVDRV